MNVQDQHKEFRASSDRAGAVRRPWLYLAFVAFMSAQATAQAQQPNCNPVYDPNTYYPALSRAGAGTIDGHDGAFIYLLDDRALVEHDVCFYEVDETVLEIDFGELDQVTLEFELPEHAAGAKVFVTENGVWVETLTLQSNSFTYVLTMGAEVGFEIATPGTRAPTVPVLITKPTTDDPEPA